MTACNDQEPRLADWLAAYMCSMLPSQPLLAYPDSSSRGGHHVNEAVVPQEPIETDTAEDKPPEEMTLVVRAMCGFACSSASVQCAFNAFAGARQTTIDLKAGITWPVRD